MPYLSDGQFLGIIKSSTYILIAISVFLIFWSIRIRRQISKNWRFTDDLFVIMVTIYYHSYIPVKEISNFFKGKKHVSPQDIKKLRNAEFNKLFGSSHIKMPILDDRTKKILEEHNKNKKK
jgi:glucan phosphoethanolaminetransferase (alkaline phosphatase superfamily)